MTPTTFGIVGWFVVWASFLTFPITLGVLLSSATLYRERVDRSTSRVLPGEAPYIAMFNVAMLGVLLHLALLGAVATALVLGWRP